MSGDEIREVWLALDLLRICSVRPMNGVRGDCEFCDLKQRISTVKPIVLYSKSMTENAAAGRCALAPQHTGHRRGHTIVRRPYISDIISMRRIER